MATYEQLASNSYSAWLAQVAGANKGNSDIRWQVGKTVTSGGVTWINRAEAVFDLLSSSEGTLPTPLRSSYATITKVELVLTVRGTHSCFAKGSAPALFAKALADYSNYGGGNNQTGECTVGGPAHGDVYPGYATTTTHQVAWSGTPAVGDTVTLDITNIYKDWFDYPTTRAAYFTVMLDAQDETDTTQAIAFDGPTGPNPAILRITYATNSTPNAGNSGRVPLDGTRVIGLNVTRSFGAYFDDADSADMLVGPSAVQVQVYNDAGLTSLFKDSGAVVPTSYSPTSHFWQTNVAMTGETRGNTYYWRYRVTDSNGATSAWSSTYSYRINRVPSPTKVRPT